MRMRIGLVCLFVFVLCCVSCQSINSPHTGRINNANSDNSSAILCRDCLQKLSGNDAVAPLLHKIEQKLKHENDFAWTNLAKINLDVLFLIIDELSIMDMMNLMKAYQSNTIFNVAKRSFWQRFRDHSIIIKPKASKEEISVINVFKRIEVCSKKIGIKILKYFGEKISHLKFNNKVYYLAKYVNKFASDSLISLDLGVVKTFEVFKKPFSRLESLSFKGPNKINTGSLSFAHIFPELKRLDLKNLSSIGVLKLEHLEHLSIRDYLNDLSQFRQMLMINPQINSIQIDMLTLENANAISGHESLRTLSIGLMRLYNFNFILNHVTTFEIQSYDNEPMQGLELPLLESLMINPNTRYFGESQVSIWSQFVRRHHSTLKYLKIYNFYGERNVGAIMPLLNEMLNAVEITVHQYEVTPEILFEIIQKHPTLLKIIFLQITISEKQITSFRERVGEEWRVTVDRKFAPKANLHVEKVLDDME